MGDSDKIEQKNRLVYIDTLRGFAILLVVLGHVLQVSTGGGTGNLLFRSIYSFHMPLFMFLSGYVSYKIGSWYNVEKRFFQLLIPFFSYIIITYVVNYFVKGGDMSFVSFAHRLWQIILRPDLALWFLWVLFFITIIFVGCRKLASMFHANEWVVIASAGVVLNLIELLTRFEKFGFHWIAWYFLFFSFGSYWRQFNIKEHITLDKCLLIISAILFPLCSYCFRLNNQPPTFYSIINLGHYFPILYRMLVAFIGIILFYELFKKYVNNNQNNILWRCFILFGQASMGVYFIHFFFLNQMCRLLFPNSVLWIRVVAAWIAVSAISYLLYYLLSKNKYTEFFILGRNTSLK